MNQIYNLHWVGTGRVVGSFEQPPLHLILAHNPLDVFIQLIGNDDRVFTATNDERFSSPLPKKFICLLAFEYRSVPYSGLEGVNDTQMQSNMP
jgi:hypothetical protein